MPWTPWPHRMRTHPHSHPHAARRGAVAAGRQVTTTRRSGCCRLRPRWHPPPQPPLPPQTLPPPAPWPQRSAPRCSKACGGGPAVLPTLPWRGRAERWHTGLRSAELCERCVGAPGRPSGSSLWPAYVVLSVLLFKLSQLLAPSLILPSVEKPAQREVAAPAAMLAALLLSSAIIAPQRPPRIVQRARCPVASPRPVITMQDKKCAQTLPDMPRTPALRLSVE